MITPEHVTFNCSQYTNITGTVAMHYHGLKGAHRHDVFCGSFFLPPTPVFVIVLGRFEFLKFFSTSETFI